MGDILSGVGSIIGATKKSPKIPAPFSGSLNTGSLSLAGGDLTRLPGSLDPTAIGGVASSLGGLATSIGGLRSQLPGLRAGLGGIGTSLESLRGQVEPGIGALTQARVQSIKNAAAESIGNLRESLSRRGVLGSSFAADAESRANIAAGQAEAEARAQGKIDEINASVQIMQAQAANFAQQLGLTEADANLFSAQIPALTAQAQALSQGLDRELNELGVIGNIRNNVSALVNQQSIAQAHISMMSSAARAYQLGSGVQRIAGSLGFGTAKEGWNTLNNWLNPSKLPQPGPADMIPGV